MGQSNIKLIHQRLRARITKAERSSYWYAGMIGEKFEVERNPQGIKLTESEAEKVRRRLGDYLDTAYYIAEEDCRLIRI
ncbi:hypothetical protein PACILC2_00820 [Paenibacillus cisolokensis]|uniref:Uncharacterized protein n=1 Tax=Paenibacillus cisolokensis TaxID=1658519 RepID=A0ABQ4N039_9BACL|nr:hypothetical protein [Paenibacillus cisolokensis]GIQ61514.1 hypothetical protein PACILC2_00820 [Paenibacillus cisolokensis]